MTFEEFSNDFIVIIHSAASFFTSLQLLNKDNDFTIHNSSSYDDSI